MKKSKTFSKLLLAFSVDSKAEAKSMITPRGQLSQSSSQSPQHEVTRSITTPPWMGCQSSASPPGLKAVHQFTQPDDDFIAV